MSKSRLERLNDYEGFVEKFKTKKTTDDCYTPPEVYAAIKEWACERYNIDPSKIVRPFYPNGDYENYKYKEGAVVLDNPPFSTLSKIIDFYLERGISFFLFCPSLVSIGYLQRGVNLIITGSQIEYENGAKVNTAFVTSFGEYAIASEPVLYKKIEEAVKACRKQAKKSLTKYEYPDQVLTANHMMQFSRRGFEFRLKRSDIHFIRSLESQRKDKKSIYGSGLLISEKAALEKAALEKIVPEKELVHQWELSETEKEIIANLG